MKNQKGGKILGVGSYGCVIDPPLMCGKKIKGDVVSKLLNLRSVDYKDVLSEYKFGQYFHKNDPNNDFFLSYIDMCKFDTVNIKKFKRHIAKDITKCGYVDNGVASIANLILSKGEDFEKNLISMNYSETTNVMTYLLLCARKMISLDRMHLDIKPPNILFKKTDKKLHPVLIDFTADFILKTDDNGVNFFQDFLPRFGGDVYIIWPIEIYALKYYDYLTIDGPKTAKLYAKKMRGPLKEKYNFDTNLTKIPLETYKDLYREATMNTKVFAGKLMVYQIAVSMMMTRKNYKHPLIGKMMSSYFNRPSLNNTLKILLLTSDIDKKHYNAITTKEHIIKIPVEIQQEKRTNIIKKFKSLFKKTPVPIKDILLNKLSVNTPTSKKKISSGGGKSIIIKTTVPLSKSAVKMSIDSKKLKMKPSATPKSNSALPISKKNKSVISKKHKEKLIENILSESAKQ